MTALSWDETLRYCADCDIETAMSDQDGRCPDCHAARARVDRIVAALRPSPEPSVDELARGFTRPYAEGPDLDD